MEIRTVADSERGCGWRKPGGLYLVSAGTGRHCGRLPIPLDVCPTCHAGWKAARGWTWVDADAIRARKPCESGFNSQECQTCPLSAPIGRAGLLWVGEKFYGTPTEFTAEAARLGISRRISAIPTDFKVGETWVLFAHRKAIEPARCSTSFAPDAESLAVDRCARLLNHDGDHSTEAEYTAGIFYMFCPSEIQYVVRGDEAEQYLESLVARGIAPVRVERARQTEQLKEAS